MSEQGLCRIRARSAAARRLGGHKEFGGDRARTADPNWPKGYSGPCDRMLKNKNCEKKNEGGIFGAMAFVFASDCSMWWRPALLGMAKHLTTLGHSEWIPPFALLVYTASALPMSFLTIRLYPPPHWESTCVGLSCSARFTDNSYLFGTQLRDRYWISFTEISPWTKFLHQKGSKHNLKAYVTITVLLLQ